MDYKKYIADVKDFPKEGILFRDITPLMQDGKVFHDATSKFVDFAKEIKADVIAGPESRGFIFGCPVAYELGIGFVPVRKPGKLPRETISCKYDLEYGSNELFMHKDAIKPGQKALIVDDLLATGGTAVATCKMIEELGGEVAGLAFVVELTGIEQNAELQKYNVKSLMKLSDQ